MLRARGAFGVLTLMGLAALSLLPAPVWADVTPPQTASIGPLDTDFGPGTAHNVPLVFNQFNPALGTLNSVTLTLSYDFIHTSTVMFMTPGTITTEATGNTVNLELPNQQPLISTIAPDYIKAVTFNPATMQLFQPFTLPSVTNSGTLAPVTFTSPSTLSAFTGTGTIGLLPAVAIAFAGQQTNNANGSAGVTTQAGVKVGLSYSYQPVSTPEPASVVLLGLGGCGLLLFRRRRVAA